jgi:hypothetical protein
MPSYDTTATPANPATSRESFCGSTAFELELVLHLAYQIWKLERSFLEEKPNQSCFQRSPPRQ